MLSPRIPNNVPWSPRINPDVMGYSETFVPLSDCSSRDEHPRRIIGTRQSRATCAAEIGLPVVTWFLPTSNAVCTASPVEAIVQYNNDG
jgi:hypothetical protein